MTYTFAEPHDVKKIYSYPLKVSYLLMVTAYLSIFIIAGFWNWRLGASKVDFFFLSQFILGFTFGAIHFPLKYILSWRMYKQETSFWAGSTRKEIFQRASGNLLTAVSGYSRYLLMGLVGVFTVLGTIIAAAVVQYTQGSIYTPMIVGFIVAGPIVLLLGGVFGCIFGIIQLLGIIMFIQPFRGRLRRGAAFANLGTSALGFTMLIVTPALVTLLWALDAGDFSSNPFIAFWAMLHAKVDQINHATLYTISLTLWLAIFGALVLCIGGLIYRFTKHLINRNHC